MNASVELSLIRTDGGTQPRSTRAAVHSAAALELSCRLHATRPAGSAPAPVLGAGA